MADDRNELRNDAGGDQDHREQASRGCHAARLADASYGLLTAHVHRDVAWRPWSGMDSRSEVSGHDRVVGSGL